MHNFTHFENTLDSDLVAQVISGDRDAFGALVGKHQSAVSGVAYAICGDFALSEDIAQETFVAAWKQISELSEASLFRGWVCGIARQIALSHVRRRSRRGDYCPAEDHPEPSSEEASPLDQAVSQEEKALLWKALNRLPETYREPLVLFYREQESVASAAAALGLTEEVLRQRLSRGRALLREEVAHQLERILGRTKPGMLFTLGVMGALPPLFSAAGLTSAATTAKAATGSGPSLGLPAGKGVVSFAGTAVCIVISSLVGLLWLYAGFKLMNAAWMPAPFRKVLRKLVVLSASLNLSMGALITWVAATQGAGLKSLGLPVAPTLASLIILLTFGNMLLVLHAMRALAHLRKEYQALHDKHREYTLHAAQYSRRYCSKARFAGLPLVSIAFGADAQRNEVQGSAKAWIALGDAAWGGLFAFGGTAVAPIAIGGATLGILSVGGASLGLLSLGGVALGWISFGGLALAWHFAAGGLAIASWGALGGLAMANDWSLGGMSSSLHANDSVALDHFNTNTLLRGFLRIAPYAGLLSLIGLPPVLSLLRKMKRKDPSAHKD